MPTPSRPAAGAGGRVLVAFHDGLLSGASLSVLRLIPLLRERGWELSFWATRPSELFEWLEGEGHRVLGYPRTIGFSLQSLRQPPGIARRLAGVPPYYRHFVRAIRSERPDLVHANSLDCLPEALVARALRVPALFHVHEMLTPKRKGALAVRLAAAAGVEMAGVSKACAARLSLDGRPARVIYEGTPLPPPVPRRKRPRPLVVGSVGVISTRKGSDIFVEAAARVLSRRNGVEFRLVGSPTDPLDREWGERVLERAAELGIRHEPRADVLAEMREWDVFVLPSRKDPFPIALLEAMGSGLPVVGTRVDGIAEQITPETGVLTRPDDPEDLARAIEELADVPERRAALGAAARRRIEQNFTVEHQAEALERAYRDTIDTARRGAS